MRLLSVEPRTSVRAALRTADARIRRAQGAHEGAAPERLRDSSCRDVAALLIAFSSALEKILHIAPQNLASLADPKTWIIGLTPMLCRSNGEVTSFFVFFGPRAAAEIDATLVQDSHPAPTAAGFPSCATKTGKRTLAHATPMLPSAARFPLRHGVTLHARD